MESDIFDKNVVNKILIELKPEVLKEKQELQKNYDPNAIWHKSNQQNRKIIQNKKHNPTLFQKYEKSYFRKIILIPLRKVPFIGSCLLWIKKYILKW